MNEATEKYKDSISLKNLKASYRKAEQLWKEEKKIIR